MQGQLAIFLLLVCIASPTTSSASRVLDAATASTFDSFDYGAVDQSIKPYDDSQLPRLDFVRPKMKEAFPEAWEYGATTNTFNAGSTQTEEYDDSPAFLEALGANANTFNVIDYGAVGNGQADDSKAFLKAWGAACGSSTQGTATLVVPKGKTFLLNSVSFHGPCKASNVNFQIQGSVVAPNNIGAWTNKDKWIQFMSVQGLLINGGGRIYGNGDVWWKICGNKESHCQRPTALHINKCDGVQLSRLTFLDSPRNHISISGCNGARVFGLIIKAPKESPNTDGIDISGSTKVTIESSVIATGDDCIAINSGSSYIKINGIQCGPGHGISVGSLGRHGEYSAVEEVQVSNCSFIGTQNGLRIKTWEGGSGYARQITFDGISFTDTQNPIIIDQHYFANPTSVLNLSKSVQVSYVAYRNINGSSADQKAITLDCGGSGCTNIVMDNVNIRSTLPNKRTYAYCNNVHGTSSFSSPHVSCLLP